MAYGARDFMRDLAILTGGSIIGIKNLSKFGLYAAKHGISLTGLAGRAVAGATGPLLSSAAFPYAAGVGLGAMALDTPQGQALLTAAEERGRQDRIKYEMQLQEIMSPIYKPSIVKTRRKKRMSKFNQSIKKGMALLKASTSYGKKGTLSNAKKAFSAVTKTISKSMKGQKAPKKGILKKVAALAPKPRAKTSRFRSRRKTPLKDYRDYDPQGA
jgi:hypothetical protein